MSCPIGNNCPCSPAMLFSTDRSYMRMIAGLLATALLALFSGGCTTTDSDLPWNTPQSWEGSPSLPGLSGQ